MKSRKILSLLLAAIMVISLIPFAVSAGGPTLITSEEEFLAMDPARNYKLANDITISSTYGKGDATADPAIADTPFTGSFDGDGYTVFTSAPVFAQLGTGAHISNLYVSGSIDGDGYTGALANSVASGATGVLVEYVYNYATITGGTAVGGLVGYIYAGATETSFVGCVNYGTIVGATSQQGGIIGYAQGKVLNMTDCVNNADLELTAGYGGGIIGRFGKDSVDLNTVGVFTTCYNYGDFSTPGAQGAGIVGYAVGNLLFIGCENHGDITNTAAIAGGIIGVQATKDKALGNLRVFDCVNYGKVSGQTVAGGIVGYDYRRNLVADGCENYGEVSANASKSAYAGGIIGRFGTSEAFDAEVTAELTYCYNEGSVTSASAYAGGVLGYCCGGAITITDTTNAGTVKGSNKTGGIVGTTDTSGDSKVDLTFERCVNTGDIYSSNNIAAGIVGYVYGNGTNFYVKCYTSVNAGTIYGSTVSSQLVGYCNSTSATIENCLAAGDLDAYEGKSPAKCLIGTGSKKGASCNVSNVFYIDDDGIEYFGYSSTAGNESLWEDVKEGKVIDVTAGQIASGEVAALLNAAIGEEVFGQNLDDFTREASSIPLPDTENQAIVYDLGDGKFSNYEDGIAPDHIVSANLAIGTDITVYVTAYSVDQIPTITVYDIDDEEYEATLVETKENGEYVFAFTGLTPQMICDDFWFSNGTHSVLFNGRDYCLYLLEEYEDDADLCAYVEALLHYCASAQTYAGYNTYDLADDELAPASDPELLTSTDKKWVKNEDYVGNVKVTAAGMYIDYRNSLYFKTSGDGNVTYFAGKSFTKQGTSEIDGSVGAIFANLNLAELGKVYSITVLDGDDMVGVLTYSGLSFIYSNQNRTDARGAFARAMLNLYRATLPMFDA